MTSAAAPVASAGVARNGWRRASGGGDNVVGDKLLLSRARRDLKRFGAEGE